MLKISDCLMMADDKLQERFSEHTNEISLRLLYDIIKRGTYSPLLYEAFYKWRTRYQEWYCGASNTSEIPNKQYNQKMWKLVKIIKEYLKNNPNVQFEVFNIGTQEGKTVLEIVKEAGIDYEFGPKREGDPPILISNCEKAKELLGWEAQIF